MRYAITKKDVVCEKKNGWYVCSAITPSGQIYTMQYLYYTKREAIRRIQWYVTFDCGIS